MKISVIIPIYNVEKYLKQCINSVLKQSYKDIEILLINDDSPDDSILICREYQSKFSNIKLINKSNGGVSDARNVGIMEAMGDYIIFLDPDDYWEKDFLSELVEIIKSDKEIEYIFFRYKTYYQRSNVLNENMLKIKRDDLKGKSGIECLNYILKLHNDYHWSACRGIIKKSFIIKENLAFKVGRNYEDILWTPSIFINAKKVDYYDEAVYVYRLERQGQITSDFTYKNLEDSIYVANYWYTKLGSMEINEETRILMMSNIATRYFFAIWFCDFISKTEKDKILILLKENKHLLGYSNDCVSKITSILCASIGFSLTSKLFRCLIKVKRKSKKLLIKINN